VIAGKWAPLTLQLCILPRSSGFGNGLIFWRDPDLNHVADFTVSALLSGDYLDGFGLVNDHDRFLLRDQNHPFVLVCQTNIV